MFESRISAGETESEVNLRKFGAHVDSWSYDMEGHAKKWVERKILRIDKQTY